MNLLPVGVELADWPYASANVTPMPTHCQNPQAPSAAENLIDNNEGVGPNGLDGGYVPGQGTGAGASSGVTIGYGFDLAQHSLADLQSAGVSQAGQNASSPYLETKIPWYNPNENGGVLTWKYVTGVTGTAAQNLLSGNGGLTLSSSDVTWMDTFAYDQAVNIIEGQVGYSTYIQMPELLQDVLADVTYVTGSLPLTMVNDIELQNWSNFANDIQNIASMSQTRKDVDINLLNQARSSGAMPASGSLC